MNLFILFLTALYYESSDSGRIQLGNHKNARPISKRSIGLWKRQDDFGYLEQCSILQFWDKQIGRVNVLAFFDSSWQFSHRQATMLRVLRERFERTGFDNIQFFAVNAPPGMAQFIDRDEIFAEEEAWRQISPSESEEPPQLQLTPEALAEALGPHVYFIQDDERLQIWAKLRALRDQILVIDRCGRLTYQIIVPWSILHFPYVKAAILSTYKDEPCGYCEFQELDLDTLTTDTSDRSSELEHLPSESSNAQTLSEEATESTSTYVSENIKIKSETSNEATPSIYEEKNTLLISETSKEAISTQSENTQVVTENLKHLSAPSHHNQSTNVRSENSAEATSSLYQNENTEIMFKAPGTVASAYPGENTTIMLETSTEATITAHHKENKSIIPKPSKETPEDNQTENIVLTSETDEPLVSTDRLEINNSPTVVTEEFSNTATDSTDYRVISSTFEALLKNQTEDDQDRSTNYDQSVISTSRPDADAGSSLKEQPITDLNDENFTVENVESRQLNELSTLDPGIEDTEPPTSDDYSSILTNITDDDTAWIPEELRPSTPIYQNFDSDTSISQDSTTPMNSMESKDTSNGRQSEGEVLISTENYTSFTEEAPHQTDAGPIFPAIPDVIDPLFLNNALEDEIVNATTAEYPSNYFNSTSVPNYERSTDTDDPNVSNVGVTDDQLPEVTTNQFNPETDAPTTGAFDSTEREELRLTNEDKKEEWDDRDIKSRSTNARSASDAENNSTNSIEVTEVDSEPCEEQLSSPEPEYLLPIRIIMRAPHVDEYSDSSMKAHEYLVLKTGQPGYHDHLDQLAMNDGIGYVDDQQQQLLQQVPRPEVVGSASGVRRTFGKDESPGLYGEVADYWRKFGNELDRTSTQHSSDGDYDETLVHETSDFTVAESTSKPSSSPLLDDANNGTTEGVSENVMEFKAEIETGNDKNVNKETDSLEDDYDIDEEAKSQLIAHYSKLLPWLYYVLAK